MMINDDLNMNSLIKAVWVSAILFIVGCVASNDGAVNTVVDNVQVDEVTTTSSINIVDISVTAKRWEFIPDTITVKQGDVVRLSVKSIDVSHGLAIPEFGVNEFLVAGKTIEIEFVADKAGVFPFFCSVQCGAGHSTMNGQLIVE